MPPTEKRITWILTNVWGLFFGYIQTYSSSNLSYEQKSVVCDILDAFMYVIFCDIPYMDNDSKINESCCQTSSLSRLINASLLLLRQEENYGNQCILHKYCLHVYTIMVGYCFGNVLKILKQRKSMIWSNFKGNPNWYETFVIYDFVWFKHEYYDTYKSYILLK